MSLKQSMGLLFITVLMILGFVGASNAAAEVYSIDKDHSFANWTIRHVVSKPSSASTVSTVITANGIRIF